MLIYNTLYTTVCPACTCFIFYFCLLITQIQMVLDTGYLSYYDVTDLQWIWICDGQKYNDKNKSLSTNFQLNLCVGFFYASLVETMIVGHASIG